jgi:hypothetical protein
VTFSFLELMRETEPCEVASSAPFPAVVMRVTGLSDSMFSSRDLSPVMCSLAPESMIQRSEPATRARWESLVKRRCSPELVPNEVTTSETKAAVSFGFLPEQGRRSRSVDHSCPASSSSSSSRSIPSTLGSLPPNGWANRIEPRDAPCSASCRTA